MGGGGGVGVRELLDFLVVNGYRRIGAIIKIF